MARSEHFYTNARKSPRLQAIFFSWASSPCTLQQAFEEPETDGVFLHSHNIWTLCLQEPDDSCPQVLYLLLRYKKNELTCELICVDMYLLQKNN